MENELYLLDLAQDHAKRMLEMRMSYLERRNRDTLRARNAQFLERLDQRFRSRSDRPGDRDCSQGPVGQVQQN